MSYSQRRLLNAVIILTAMFCGAILGQIVAPGTVKADPNDSLERSAVKAAGELSEISETLKKIDRKMK